MPLSVSDNTLTLTLNYAFSADVCECLGDMTPEQSLVVLELACYDDQFLDEAYHFSNHTDVDGVGLVLIANKTRWVENI